MAKKLQIGARKKTGEALKAAKALQEKEQKSRRPKKKGSSKGKVSDKLLEAANKVESKSEVKKNKSKLPKTPKSEVNLFENAVLFVATFGLPGNVRRVKDVDTEIKIEGKEITAEDQKRFFQLEKILLNSPELDAIGKFDNKVRAELTKHSLNWPLRRGCYLVPIGMLDAARQLFDQRKKERDELVDQFIAVYPSLIKEAEQRLGPAYDPDQYAPTKSMQQRFIMERRLRSEITPNSLKTLDDAVFDEERKSLSDEMRGMYRHITNDLRTGVLEAVRRFTKALMPTKDGKRKRLYEGNIENLMFFLETFGKKNIVNDKDCAKLVEDALGLIGSGSVENITSSIRTDDDLRANLLEEFDKIGDQISSMVYEDESRMIAI